LEASNDIVSAEHRQQALEWLVTMWSGEVTPEEQLALSNWRQAAPEHELAWLQLAKMEQRLRSVPPQTAGLTLRESGRRNQRRTLLRGLLLVCGGGAAVYTLRGSSPWQTMTAQYATATGERRDLVLADGTRISMNTATAFDVHFDAGLRRIDLHKGEILVTTAHEPATPHRDFVVVTRHGTARALGTRFTVYQGGEHTRVEVYEGVVEVRPRLSPDAPLRLAAGSQLRFTAAAADAVRALPSDYPAWLDGVLEAEQMRLQDFLVELGRYRRGVIRCDPAVANEVVSGRYPLGDTDKVLAALEQALPVRISYATPYWVTVQAKKK
jgi:transmembrane sensor